MTVLLLAILFLQVGIPELRCNITFQNKTPFRKILLEIGILSARRNFDTRQAIRQTWMSSVKENKELENVVNIHFIVGKACEIHPDNRLDVFSCQANNWSYIQKNDNNPLVSVSDLNSLSPHILISNISLSVKHPMVIGRLGLNIAVHLSKRAVKVILHDDFLEEEIASVRFNVQDLGIALGAYRYQSIEPVLLPQGFQGSLRIVTDNRLRLNETYLKAQHWKINNYGGALYVRSMDEDKVIGADFTNCVFLLSFLASVFDIEKLNSIVEKQNPLNQEWTKQEENVTDLLALEEKKHHDILFVDVTDVYRNLPLKLLSFHKWVNSNPEFTTEFVLKTDDDCFLDVEKVVSRLASLNQIKKLWWSNFRDNWFVERYGKWTESDFIGSTYPRFACGSGNVVSSDISHWLALNYNHLKSYQGEDVSMGIWLNAIGPNFIVDTAWHCDKSCSKDLLVMPELNESELRDMWKSKLECSNPCGCKK